jgi:drug/metabolite transporter (DMT)-like permease
VSAYRVIALTSLAMIAFAGNSLLCRVALKHTSIDPASFTTIRLLAGAVMLWLLTRTNHNIAGSTPADTRNTKQNGRYKSAGNWLSALALFAYAAGFSFAYVSLPAATGALLLFGAVQITMISHGMWSGERLRGTQLFGLLLAFGGLVGLLLPGLPGISAPPLLGSLLMLGAGVAWGIYSLRGKRQGDRQINRQSDAKRVTAGNFPRATPFALTQNVLMFNSASFDIAGFGYAVASGALASGIGYAIWYTALPALKATTAATVQLSVPVIAALGGVIFLGEAMSLRLVLASIAILLGIALVILRRRSE